MTNLVRYSIQAADPNVVRVQDGMVLQGKAAGTTTVQVDNGCVHVRVHVALSVQMHSHVLSAGAVPRDIVGPGREEHQGAG